MATALHLENVPDDPVAYVLCGAFLGPGSQAMAATFRLYTCLPTLGWAVFQLTGDAWQLVMKRKGYSTLTAAGSQIQETVPVFRDGDPRCIPSGGSKGRLWHWNGTRLTAGAWKQATFPTNAAFTSPSQNLRCVMRDTGSDGDVFCQSFEPLNSVGMDVGGRVTTCLGTGDCKGHSGEDEAYSLLPYGKQLTVGGFRCQSQEIGVTCTVIQSGKGFLINRDGITRVGP